EVIESFLRLRGRRRFRYVVHGALAPPRPTRLVDHRPHQRPADVGVERRPVANLAPPPMQRDERDLGEIVGPVPVATQQVRAAPHGIQSPGEVLRELLLIALIHAPDTPLLSKGGTNDARGCTRGVRSVRNRGSPTPVSAAGARVM